MNTGLYLNEGIWNVVIAGRDCGPIGTFVFVFGFISLVLVMVLTRPK